MTTSFKEVTARELDPRSFLTTFVRTWTRNWIVSCRTGASSLEGGGRLSRHERGRTNAADSGNRPGQSPSEGYLQVTANVDAQRKENDS